MHIHQHRHRQTGTVWQHTNSSGELVDHVTPRVVHPTGSRVQRLDQRDEREKETEKGRREREREREREQNVRLTE
jgi:hypothetical protein